MANLETLALPSGLKMELESTREEFLEKVRLQAVGFYQARRNDETIEVLLWANKQYPRSEHLVLVGMTWLRMGKPKRARTAFRIARDLAKEQSMTDEVDNFLRQIREGTWDADRVFFPYVDLSAGYNTNVFSEFVDPQAKVGYKVATGGVLHLHRGEANFANLRYRLLWEEYDGLVDDQFLTYSVSVQFIHDKDNWLYEITPRFQHQFVNLASNLYKPGAFLRLQRRIDSSEYGLSVDYAVGKSTQDEVAYLAGPTSSVTLFWNSYWPELQATFFVFGEREDIGVYESTPGDTTPLAFDGFGPGLRLIWYPTDAWEFSGGVTYSKRTYKPTALPEDVIRSDAQTSLWTRAGYRLDKDLSLYISGDFTGNRSTLDSTNLKNKNYNQGSVFGGVTWELSL
ncbi:MAG: transporter [Bdellovibrionia bacterium]